MVSAFGFDRNRLIIPDAAFDWFAQLESENKLVCFTIPGLLWLPYQSQKKPNFEQQITNMDFYWTITAWLIGYYYSKKNGREAIEKINKINAEKQNQTS